jgi:hypothetical protein
MAGVILQHAGFPGVRFCAQFGPQGRVIVWQVGDWRLFKSQRELGAVPSSGPGVPDDDPAWGPVSMIGATSMRSFPWGELERVARDACRGNLLAYTTLEPTDTDSLSQQDLDRIAQVGESLRRVRRGDGQAHDDLFFARIAQSYVKAAKSAKPVAAVAKTHGYSKKTIANFLTQARDRKLLTETSPGRAGGTLTRTARQLLKEAEGQ